ncbi:Cytochrome P450 [Streptomyces noursei ATCC 11455]|nr:Cytochrome P450 [Streptomyces noursei ATCC 11455]
MSRPLPTQSIPTAPRARPCVGHLVPLLWDPLAFLNSLPAHGKLVRIRLGPFALVVICDPELTHQVLIDDRLFDKGGPLIGRLREVPGDGAATCPHSAHRRLRRLAQPAFHPARLPGYAEPMTARPKPSTPTAGTPRASHHPAKPSSLSPPAPANASAIPTP